jgi:hypothetical protein
VTENGDATALDRAQGAADAEVAVDTGVRLVNTVRAGGHRASLEALAERLAWAAAECPPDKVAPAAVALQRVLDRLASLPVADGQGVIDELSRRREQRERASAADGGAAPAAGAPTARDLLDGG